jgi:NTP pyrophosphatase (non-canonical NTP hydrolase)
MAKNVVNRWKSVPMTSFAEVQARLERTYGNRDRARGAAMTIAWLYEEVGDLAKAARKGTREEQLNELSDVMAWVIALANQLGLSLDEALERYADGCPRCKADLCICPSWLSLIPAGATVAALEQEQPLPVAVVATP